MERQSSTSYRLTNTQPVPKQKTAILPKLTLPLFIAEYNFICHKASLVTSGHLHGCLPTHSLGHTHLPSNHWGCKVRTDKALTPNTVEQQLK